MQFSAAVSGNEQAKRVSAHIGRINHYADTNVTVRFHPKGFLLPRQFHLYSVL